MERWQNRVAAVTGASSGIGAATVKDLLNANLIVVGLARRLERMEDLKAQLPAEQQKRFHAVACDVSSQESVDMAFDWIIKELGGVDILINNAGIFKTGQASTLDAVELQQVIQTNVMGVVYCTQRAFKSMKERNFDGHVVIVNSVLGHVVPIVIGNNRPPIMNVYGPSKFALTALTEVLRQEFRGLNTKIKITSVSPGLTDTEIIPEQYKGAEIPILKSEDISSCILFTLSTPPHMQIFSTSLALNCASSWCSLQSRSTSNIMERWQNRVAVVTGASSGIGAVTVKDLLNANLIVVGLARRLERMAEFKAQLPAEQQKRFHAVACDVSSQESVDTAFDWIIKEVGGVDILINNAGTLKAGQTTSLDPVIMQQIMQTNVMGVVYCTQRAFKSMKERNFDGHVVIVNSVLGHWVPITLGDYRTPIMNIYGPSKFAITALTEVLRQEFRGLNTKIKITSVSPGLTDTEIVPEQYRSPEIAILKSEDISNCIMFTLSTPPHMQVHEITVRPMLGE